jgi:hypothetical protein
MLYAFLEQDVRPTTVLHNPQLYGETQTDKRRKFFRSLGWWLGTGVWHSVLVREPPSLQIQWNHEPLK